LLQYTNRGQEVELELKWVEKALNMVISTVLSRGSFSLKANKFFVTGGHESLGPSLCAIRGYFYSVKPGMAQILLNCKSPSVGFQKDFRLTMTLVSSCTSAFYQPILVSEFLSDEFTFRSRDERLTQLRGLRVQLTYEPASKAKRSHSATIEARIKSIAGTGIAVGLQKFTLDGRDGQPDSEITVQQHFKDSTFTPHPVTCDRRARSCSSFF
jgi:eukaryotic translation initiation factor 2C